MAAVAFPVSTVAAVPPAAATSLDLSNPFNHCVYRTRELFLAHGLVLSFIAKEKVERASQDRAFFAANKLEVDVASRGLNVPSQSTRITTVADTIHTQFSFIPRILVQLMAEYTGAPFYLSESDPFYAHVDHAIHPGLPFFRREDASSPLAIPAIYVSPVTELGEVAVFHTLPPDVSYIVRKGDVKMDSFDDHFVSQVFWPRGTFLFEKEGYPRDRNAFLLVFQPVSYLALHGTPYRLDSVDGVFYPRFQPSTPLPWTDGAKAVARVETVVARAKAAKYAALRAKITREESLQQKAGTCTVM